MVGEGEIQDLRMVGGDEMIGEEVQVEDVMKDEVVEIVELVEGEVQVEMVEGKGEDRFKSEYK
jgi:hypothetical protein